MTLITPKVATMSELKCPFCQQELVRHWGMEEPALYCCDNPKCSRGGVATESAWQELIRTRKALDVALCSLQDIAESDGDFITGSSTTLDAHEYAEMMLDKIKTALEQKE